MTSEHLMLMKVLFQVEVMVLTDHVSPTKHGFTRSVGTPLFIVDRLCGAEQPERLVEFKHRIRKNLMIYVKEME